MNEMFSWLFDLPEQVLNGTSDVNSPFVIDCKNDSVCKNLSLDLFSSIFVDAPVIYEHEFSSQNGGCSSIEITGPENAVKNLEISVNGGCLEIKTIAGMKLGAPITIKTIGASIKKVVSMNHSRIMVRDVFCHQFELHCNDHSSVSLSGVTSKFKHYLGDFSSMNIDNLRVVSA